MSHKKSVGIGWLVFTSVILCEILIDFLLRRSSDEFRYGGMPEPLWFGIQLIAALVAVFFLIKGVRYLKRTSHIILSVSVNAILGIVFYTLAIYGYILGFGIDSF